MPSLSPEFALELSKRYRAYNFQEYSQVLLRTLQCLANRRDEHHLVKYLLLVDQIQTARHSGADELVTLLIRALVIPPLFTKTEPILSQLLRRSFELKTPSQLKFSLLLLLDLIPVLHQVLTLQAQGLSFANAVEEVTNKAKLSQINTHDIRNYFLIMINCIEGVLPLDALRYIAYFDYGHVDNMQQSHFPTYLASIDMFLKSRIIKSSS